MARQVDGRMGQTLLEAMRSVFPDAEAPCGGAGRCGRCRVSAREVDAAAEKNPALDSASDEEKRLLGPESVEAGWRLSCRARFIRDGSVSVEYRERAFFLPDTESGGVRNGPQTGYCLGVDIGTTTIDVAAAETSGGRILARASAANRQRIFGPDVVSRIGYAVHSAKNLTELQSVVRGQVGELAGALVRKLGDILPERIHICGNTTMLHLWEGADVSGLGRMPFHPAFLESRGSQWSLDGGKVLPCTLLPCVSAFIGADISAGIAATGLYDVSDPPEMLVDIGTNGEIVLAAGGRLTATATAAGPAFEGVTISCGIPAVDGAVDHVTFLNGCFSFTTLGDLPPAGICGSGLLDLLAYLRRAGLLDENGGLKVPAGPDGIREFTLPSDPPLRITQADVRQLQLAKGAIAAGIRVLCQRAGVELEDIASLHLAGGFGSRMSSESAVVTGLIPGELAGRIEAGGNTALAGTLMTARDPALLERIARTVPSVQVLDLSREPAFPDAFVNAMRFPAPR